MAMLLSRTIRLKQIKQQDLVAPLLDERRQIYLSVKTELVICHKINILKFYFR